MLNPPVTSPDTDLEPFVARVPGSKSLTNRSLILAAHRVGRSVIRNALHSDDTLRLAAALDSFGGISASPRSDGFVVERQLERITAPSSALDLGGAGTPARLLLSFAAAAEGTTVIDGNRRLRERPMTDLLDCLGRIGVNYACLGRQGSLPVRIAGSAVTQVHWVVNGSVSSQFASSLLLFAAQQPSSPITLVVEGAIVSRPYIDMSVHVMRKCGIPVEQLDSRSYRVTPARPTAGEFTVETDASGMSYFLAAAALTGRTVQIRGIGRNSPQGDAAFISLLADMGCRATVAEDRIEISGRPLRGINVDMRDMPDVVLTLAAIASQATGPSTIHNIANLRVKESDRITAAVTELRRVGVNAEEGSDWMRIHPARRLEPALVRTYDDHRVAMAFAVLKLIDKRIAIEAPECVAKSFPGFWQEFERFRRRC